MEIGFWQQRWQEDQTGFHMSEVNEYLSRYWSAINAPGVSTQAPPSVFVPLCGKSLDLVWLAAQAGTVIGVECSEKAVTAFFEEQQLAMQSGTQGAFNCYTGANITLYQGDFFALDKAMLQDVSAVYDRASLVALPEAMRQRYIEKLADVLPQTVSILLISLEYDQQKMTGPPFSVSDDEVQRLYKPFFNVEQLEARDIIDNEPRFRDRGLDYMIERVYKIFR
ncbi:Thiopurine S-methyltransferase [hydrothermal vent metagenome]|uniref:thiopurine S-methyltransferase n=1 Tax=hydrothermal vent metagenome TaxID=652676 RepID=A0A3B0Y3B1_9ZZZZ